MQVLADNNESHFADAGGFVSPSGLSYIGGRPRRLAVADDMSPRCPRVARQPRSAHCGAFALPPPLSLVRRLRCVLQRVSPPVSPVALAAAGSVSRHLASS